MKSIMVVFMWVNVPLELIEVALRANVTSSSGMLTENESEK